MIYLTVLLLLLWLSIYYDINGGKAIVVMKEKKANRIIWYRLMLVVFILIAGLRWRVGIDTPVYLYSFYHDCPTLEKFSFFDYHLGEDPLWLFLNSVVKTLGGRFFYVQLIHATFINILIFSFIKKYSDYWFTSLFFYAITCYTTYNMEIMRGSISIVICLFAYDNILGKKWLKGYFLLFIALMFHAQTLVMFALPFFFFLRFNKVGILACIVSLFLGMVIMSVFSDFIFLLDAGESIERKVSVYSNSDLYGTQGGNFNFFIVKILPLLLYSILSCLFLKFKCPSCKLMKFEPLIILGIMFILIRVNLEIAYRYVDYFKIYFVLIFSESFVRISKVSSLQNRLFAYVKSIFVFLPLILVLLVYDYVLSKNYSLRYTPYSSVFNRTPYKEREKMYNEMTISKAFYPTPNINEY